MSNMSSPLPLERIDSLRAKHRDLDQQVNKLAGKFGVDPQQLQALKKRKLHIKDELTRLETGH